jgi:hypothetical protein
MFFFRNVMTDFKITMEKSSTSGKKIKLTKSNTNVEQKNPTQKYIPGIIPNDIERPISESHNSLNSDFEICHYISKKEHELRQKCRKVGINFAGIYFCVGFFCSTFVLDFVSLIFFPDVDDFSCGCFLFSCFFPFDILFLYILFK